MTSIRERELLKREMSPTTDAALNVERLKPLKGESVENLAARCYSTHIEVLSAWAMTDLDEGWHRLPKSTQDGWRKLARDKLRKKKS